MHKSLSIEKVICLYRYLSWALTSLVYLISKPYNVIHYKVGVIISLLVFSMLINNLYIKSFENKSSIKKLVLIETIGIEFLLLPTGGLTSSFIWYALNPILVSAIYLSSYFSWVNLLFYLITGSIMSYSLFNPDSIELLHIIHGNLNLILVFILINLAVQILSNLTNELNKSNKIKEESIEHIMSLYQMIETLNNHSSKDKLFESLTKYSEKLTKSNQIIFWLREDNLIKSNTELIDEELESIILKLNIIKLQNEYQYIELINSNFIIFPIISTSTFYGAAAFQYNKNLNNSEINQILRLLKFISELCAVILERFDQEGIEEHLLVMEEQNRIADEMHDSVSQRLFSISYGIHGLLGRLDSLSEPQIREYLTELKQSSDMAMKELRNSIYKLSSRKNGEKYLQSTIHNFLNSISKLQNVNIESKIDCDENLLTIEIKKGIIRIIKEACGNAIRHGNCKNIFIYLNILNNNASLTIEDDGNGFLLNKIENKGGIGISNMRSIVNNFNGEININSNENVGTKIMIFIPIKVNSNEKEGSLAL